MDYSSLFVCLMGMGTVFVGLICIIVLVTLMSRVVHSIEKQPTQPAIPSQCVQSTVTPELVAAVSAAIAEESGTAASAIRIISFKKV